MTKKPLKAIPNLREASSISSEKETKNVVDKKTMTHNGIEIAGIPKDEWLKYVVLHYKVPYYCTNITKLKQVAKACALPWK